MRPMQARPAHKCSYVFLMSLSVTARCWSQNWKMSLSRSCGKNSYWPAKRLRKILTLLISLLNVMPIMAWR
ncbi:hypothetical protein [Undibacterium sp. KW1]|uniref:accessory Sec system protein Asp5 n=1 Tax=Undibacterium sp. KW1 TaxID=2058624 RepID=UPI00351B8340